MFFWFRDGMSKIIEVDGIFDDFVVNVKYRLYYIM